MISIEFQGGVPTPGENEISRSLLSGGGDTSLRSQGQRVRDAFTRWLQAKSTTAIPGVINVCLSDFVDKQYVDSVISLNSITSQNA